MKVKTWRFSSSVGLSKSLHSHMNFCSKIIIERNVTNKAIMNINMQNNIHSFEELIICVFSQRSSEGYQTAQMPAMYAYGGYMYGPTVSGYYDYSQPANYGQYSTATTSVSRGSVCTALCGGLMPVVV